MCAFGTSTFGGRGSPHPQAVCPAELAGPGCGTLPVLGERRISGGRALARSGKMERCVVACRAPCRKEGDTPGGERERGAGSGRGVSRRGDRAHGRPQPSPRPQPAHPGPAGHGALGQACWLPGRSQCHLRATAPGPASLTHFCPWSHTRISGLSAVGTQTCDREWQVTPRLGTALGLTQPRGSSAHGREPRLSPVLSAECSQ